jgi:hypothetical protein
VIVNETVRRSLREDAVDLEDYRRRAKEPSRDFEGFLKDLRRRGKL